jgi:capsular exopolysaccharide synthesis family protein
MPNGPQNRSTAELLHVLWERRLVIAVSTVVAVLISLVLSASADKQYTATSELLLRDPGFAKTLFGADLFEGSVDPERETSTKIAVIRSPAVTDAVRRSLNGRFDNTSLRDAIEVSSNENSDVVTVAATTENPRTAAAVANAYAREYITYQRELDRRKVNDAKELVQENLDALPEENVAERQGLLDSMKQLTVLEALQTGNADIVARATPPDSPSSPKALRAALLAGVIGLLIGLGAALLADFLDRRLKTTEDFERALGYPVLVSVPRRALPSATDYGMTGFKSEPYRMLREGLRFLDMSGRHRCILVTSADAGEGKTTVAVNLARALAAGGERAILVEADLRRPSASAQLGLETFALGLSTGLVSGRPVSELLVPVPGNGFFDLLPSGPSPPNPADLLRLSRMGDLLDEAVEAADVVIIDAAPLLPVSDTRALLDLPNIDGVLLVTRAFATRRDRAAEARRVLAQSDRKVLGVVVTGTHDAAGDYQYYGAETGKPPRRGSRRARRETLATTPADAE